MHYIFTKNGLRTCLRVMSTVFRQRAYNMKMGRRQTRFLSRNFAENITTRDKIIIHFLFFESERRILLCVSFRNLNFASRAHRCSRVNETRFYFRHVSWTLSKIYIPIQKRRYRRFVNFEQGAIYDEFINIKVRFRSWLFSTQYLFWWIIFVTIMHNGLLVNCYF